MIEQLDFFNPVFRGSRPSTDLLQVGFRTAPLQFVRNDAARRYILRVTEQGWARVTVPRRGTLKAAREFVHRHLAWIERQLQRRETLPARPAIWANGTEILLRGEKTPLVIDAGGKAVRLAEQIVPIAGATGNVRPAVERHLRKMALAELVRRTRELALLHQLSAGRVSVRDQRSRWGSCSVKRTISLNWRLIQTPAFVQDYIILHELMHLREMNHSRRFWQQVERVCPEYAKAEAWLKQHTELLK